MTRSISNNVAGRDRIRAALDRLGIDYYPSRANFMCAHFPVQTDIGPTADDVVRHLADRGIAVRPLGSFGMPEHVRISVGTPDEVTALCEALATATAGKGPGARDELSGPKSS